MMMLSRRPTLRSGILLFILWFILIVLGIVWHIDYRKYVSACTEQTAGIVTNVYVNESKRGRSGRTEISYKAAVAYQVPGSDAQYTLTTGQRKEGFYEGQQLTVMYAPDDVSYAYCKEAFSDNGKGLIAFSFFFGGLGLIFTITALRDRKNAMGY